MSKVTWMESLKNIDNIMKKFQRINVNEPAMVSKHTFLRFKGLSPLKFKDLKIEWGDVLSFFGDMTTEEAKYRSEYDWDALELFYQRNNAINPHIFRVEQGRYSKKFLTDFFKELDPPNNAFRIINSFGDSGFFISDTTVILQNDLIMNFDGRDVTFYYNPNVHYEESKDNLFYSMICVLNEYVNEDIEANKIHVVYRGDFGFEKMAFDVKHIDVNIEQNYNDDFVDISKTMIEQLNQKDRAGLYILSGEPGTGKTSWIRYLTGKIHRNIIFVSPDMVEYITEPTFIPFLMNNSDSVLIIEDAEPALAKRDGSGRSGAISNILNLTDGLLSDCLNISIVATFNTNTRDIDEALLRGGRLINSYHFEKLEKNKSTALLKKLGHDVEATSAMTLADIYSFGKDNKSTAFNKKKIGFFK